MSHFCMQGIKVIIFTLLIFQLRNYVMNASESLKYSYCQKADRLVFQRLDDEKYNKEITIIKCLLITNIHTFVFKCKAELMSNKDISTQKY